MKKAAAKLNKMAEIEEEVHGISRDRIAVFGVSQGGAMASTLYMRYKYKSIVSLIGYLPINSTYPAEMTDDSASAPLLMYHGDQDEIVPVEAARLSAQIMQNLGRNVTYIELEGESHALKSFPQVLVASAEFLRKTVPL